MSEYHKIETLYERDEQTHRLKPELILKNRVYGLIKTWQFTEKIDGTNIRCMFTATPQVAKDNLNDIFYTRKLTFGGKTDNAQIHADLVKYLYETITPEKMAAAFPVADGEPPADVVVYGEGYGAGIQKGGDYCAEKRFIVFDVLVGGKWWLAWEAVCDVAAKLGLPTVPFAGEMTLEDATKAVRAGFPSALNGGKMRAEGLVGRPIEALFDKKGHRLIVKLKTKDF